MITHKHRRLEDEEVQQALSFLNDATSVETLALKGHLFVEYWLNEAILEHLNGTQEFLETLNFHQKCLLAKAIKLVEKDDFYDHLSVINQIRNRFAHTLFPKNIEELISKLPLQKKDAEGKFLPPVEILRGNLVMLFVVLTLSQAPKEYRAQVVKELIDPIQHTKRNSSR
jgi:hypothetical protein